MKTEQSKIDLLKEVVELEKTLKYNANMIEKIVAMMLVIADNLVERNEIEKIWEEISMLKVIEYAEEKGMEKGIEKGIEKGREEELLETVTIQLKKKFKMGILPSKISMKLQEAPMTQLKGIRDNIFDIEILEDILTYLK